MLIYDQQERLLAWACEKIGIDSFRSDATAIGQEKDGELVAVVVFDTFSPTDCAMHIASDGTGRWMNKELLVSSFAYPFIQLGYPRITGIVAESNTKALEFDLKLGFKREGYCRKAAKDGGAIIVLGMLKEECRFIPRTVENA